MMLRMKGGSLAVVAVVSLAGYSLPHDGQTAATRNPAAHIVAAPEDSTAVVQVVGRFHSALAAGDSTAALALLAEDVTILESGDSETREEYRAHHLASDIAFTRAVPGHSGPRRVVIQGDVAWVASTSVAQGEFRDRKVDAVTAELMVLSRKDGKWAIRAIHWSSRSSSTR